MNPSTVLAAFMSHAVDVEVIALIAETDSKQVQATLRAELLRLAEQSQPSVSAEAPLTTARRAQAADSSPSPAPQNHAAAMKRSPVRRVVARKLEGLADLPGSLLHVAATKQRALFAYLQRGPADVSELISMAEADGVSDADMAKSVSNGLYNMLQNALVVKPESPGGKWRLA